MRRTRNDRPRASRRISVTYLCPHGCVVILTKLFSITKLVPHLDLPAEAPGRGPCKGGRGRTRTDVAISGAFNKAIAAHPSVKVVAQGQSFFSPTVGLTVVQNMLTANANLIVGSDQGIEGGVQAVAAPWPQPALRADRARRRPPDRRRSRCLVPPAPELTHFYGTGRGTTSPDREAQPAPDGARASRYSSSSFHAASPV
jgi:hypothetical protein